MAAHLCGTQPQFFAPWFLAALRRPLRMILNCVEANQPGGPLRKTKSQTKRMK